MRFLAHLLVLLQFTGIAAACYPVDFTRRGSPGWLLISVCGLAVGLLALRHNRPGNFRVYPQPKHGARLIVTGPYRYIRHPMYLSLILTLLGAALFNSHWLNFAGLALVTLAVGGKALLEERLLLMHFPGYVDYLRRTRRFIPWLF